MNSNLAKLAELSWHRLAGSAQATGIKTFPSTQNKLAIVFTQDISFPVPVKVSGKDYGNFRHAGRVAKDGNHSIQDWG